MLYAASRDLQLAGEALRAEGKLFTPDEIMQFVSDDEAKIGADAVRKLSGVEMSLPADAQDADKPDGTKQKKTAVQPNSPDKIQQQATAQPDKADQPTHRKAAAQPDDSDSLKVRHESVQDSGNLSSEVRHSFVQDKNAPDTAEIRHSNVQSGEETVREIRPKTVQGKNRAHSHKLGGQDSREFFAENRPESDNGKKSAKTDKNAQTVVFPAARTSQDVGIKQPKKKQRTPHSRNQTLPSEDGEAGSGETTLHENKSDFGKVLHETKSDLSAGEAKLLHEIGSEFGDSVHEIKSEIPDTLHETKSESDENSRETLHEMKSEFADFALRELLEGLRRAKRVR